MSLLYKIMKTNHLEYQIILFWYNFWIWITFRCGLYKIINFTNKWLINFVLWGTHEIIWATGDIIGVLFGVLMEYSIW